jgi:hypothetical protein
MTKRSKQSATARRPRTTSRARRATHKSLEADFITTPNGSFSLDEWLKLSEFERYWMKRERFLWPADMRDRR